MVSFDNTVFSDMSTREVRRRHHLFRLMNNRRFVGVSRSLLMTALRLRLPIEWLVKRTMFRHFCGGETLQECLKTAEKLEKHKIRTILDYAVEGKSSEAEFDKTMRVVLGIARAGITCVVKVTALASFSLLERMSAEKRLTKKERKQKVALKKRLVTLCKEAEGRKVQLFIDAEESWIQPAIDALARDLMVRFNKTRAVVFTTLQMYRNDRLEFLRAAYNEARAGKYILGVKLVRGAYMEKERRRAKKFGYASPIYPSKRHTDHAYDKAVRFLVDHSKWSATCLATHNEKSTQLLLRLMKKGRFSFAQLLGMGDAISYSLAKAGYIVYKYVPYGPVREVVPYLIRRAQENSSVSGQVSRELRFVAEELQRRA